MKYLHNLTLIAALACTALAMPAAAAQPAASTVSVKQGMTISAVSDATEIAMPAIPGGNVAFEANPRFFVGGQLCVSGLGGNWAIKKNGTLDQKDPARRASCAPISADGKATVRNPFGPNAVPFLIAADGKVYWAGRDRLNGLNGS